MLKMILDPMGGIMWVPAVERFAREFPKTFPIFQSHK